MYEDMRVNLVTLGDDISRLRVDPKEFSKMLSILERLAKVVGTIGALQELAGETFAAHLAGHTEAADRFFEVLQTIECEKEGKQCTLPK